MRQYNSMADETEKFAAVFEKPVAYILLELEGSLQLP